ncbi:MAG: SDR family NAD(P)-dependent oxidoreductase, partial [Acidimicrobiaceae bacterium]|nr:SDR family NAD(P)-dependent oxidoreductase [Acidimicrobiaceae bacterium]
MHALLAGRVVLVSGVGPGLGAQIARDAHAAGAQVMLSARRTSYLEELAAEFQDRVACEPCDVTVDADCRAVVDATLQRFGGLDCVVGNAFAQGRAYGLTLEEADVDDWRDAFDVNVFGSLRMVKAAIPALKQSEHGSVV